MNGMTTDFIQESLHTVAITFPQSKAPSMLRASYDPKTWTNIIRGAHSSSNKTHPYFVMDDTDEGQAILLGTNPSDLTKESLVGLETAQLHELARRYKVEFHHRNKKEAIAFKILAAVAEGVIPETVKADSGE
jgi:hypothetical protein